MCVDTTHTNASPLISSDYTSPVFFWTNIEIALSVISACLPIYRPIWLYIKGKPLNTKASYKLHTYARFGTSVSEGVRWPAHDDVVEEEGRQLTHGGSVNTVVGTGILDTVDILDPQKIAVKQDMYTDTNREGPN